MSRKRAVGILLMTSLLLPAFPSSEALAKKKKGGASKDYQPEAAPTGDQPSKVLERAFKLYDGEDFYSSSIELNTVVEGESGDTEPNKQKAEFWMGKALYNMKFYSASLSYFDRIVQKGPSHAYYNATLKWLASLLDPRDPRNAEWWTSARDAIAQIDRERAPNLRLRHAEPIRWASANRPAWVRASRDELLATLRERLSGRETRQRTSREQGQAGRLPETVEEWAPALVWADVLTILVVDEALRDQSVVDSLVGQTGRTTSQLNPSGIVEIDSQRLPAQSEGAWIDAGVEVEVVKQSRFGVVVRPKTSAG